MEFVSDLVRKLKPYFAEMLDGLITGAVKFALLHVDGDVVIEGAARRIKGDFSSTPFANRLLVQSTSNATTSLGILGGGATRGSNFTAFYGADPDNTHFISLVASASDVSIISLNFGTGTVKPLRLKSGASTAMEIDTAGEMNLTPANRVFLKNCTAAPSDTPVGGGYWFVQNGALKYKGSAGTVTTIAPA